MRIWSSVDDGGADRRRRRRRRARRVRRHGRRLPVQSRGVVRPPRHHRGLPNGRAPRRLSTRSRPWPNPRTPSTSAATSSPSTEPHRTPRRWRCGPDGSPPWVIASMSRPPTAVRATEIVDLGGAALLPGFIDPHSHYINALSVANQVNVFAPPAGPGADVAAIVAALRAFRDSHPIPAGDMLVAYGYDDTMMPGGRTLSKDDLDTDFPDTPVLVGHVSMHGAVLNSAAMRKFDITADTVTPPRRGDRPQGRLQRARRAGDGDRVPADLRGHAQADARAGGRVEPRPGRCSTPQRESPPRTRAPRTPPTSR